MEEQDSEVTNPFASPNVAKLGSIPDVDTQAEFPEFSLGKSITKWSLICCVSAAPSFVFGIMLGPEHLVQAAAMLLGVLTFISIYVYVESREWTRRRLMDQSLRIAVRVGYITRITISVIFPLAFFFDIWCGVISVGLTSALVGGQIGPRGFAIDDPVSVVLIFSWFYFTTLVQGIALNVVLGGYTLVVYGLTVLIRGGNKSS